MRCTGACCGGFSISAPLPAVKAWADLAALRGDVEARDEFARIFAVLRPRPDVEGGMAGTRVACSAFAGGRCRQYAGRPRMCSEYPREGACRSCGAQSDAEARGVALAVAPGGGRR